MDLESIKQYASEKKIPIILDEGLELLEKIIRKYDVKDALEIGTAIGYSALSMASFGVNVDTIERDPLMYEQAIVHIKNLKKEHQVKAIYADAITYEKIDKMYDLIFIDAAKSKYEILFQKYQKYLKPKGIIVCDNIHFHHLDKKMVKRRTRQLLEKLEKFKNFLKENKDFETIFFNDGDGMSVSRYI